MKSGAGTKEVWVSKWPLLNVCKFLLPQFGHRSTEGNLGTDALANEESQSSTYEHVEEEGEEHENYQCKEKKKSQMKKSIEENNKTKKQKHDLNDAFLTKILMEDDDEEDLFGKTVAKKLKKLPTGV